MKTMTGWIAAAGLAVGLSAGAGRACDGHDKAAGAAAATDEKAVVARDATPDGKGCCAKKHGAEAKMAAAPAAGTPAAIAAIDAKGCDKPCDAAKTADGKGCPKKAAQTATQIAQTGAEPAKDAEPPSPGIDH